MIWCMPMSCTWEVVVKACVVIAGFLTISSRAFPLSEHVSLSSGHSLSGLYRNSGPFHQLFSATNSLAVIPRDGLLAGFWLPGQNFHDSGVVCSRISCTLFMTYCFHGLTFFIQHNTVMESTQYTDSNLWGNAFCTAFASRTRIVAPSNSSLGILCFFSGATFVFDATKFTSIRPSS